jgi:TonB family protein
VLLELSIDASGTIKAVRILWSGCRRLEQAAVSAAGQWRFEEVRVNGEPTPFKMVADVPFRLPEALKPRAGRTGACKWTQPPNRIR